MSMSSCQELPKLNAEALLDAYCIVQYGRGFRQLPIPSSYRWTGEIRVPRLADYFFSPGLNVSNADHGLSASPCLILKPIKRKRLVFEQIGVLKAGEHLREDAWLSRPDALYPFQAYVDGGTLRDDYLIFTRREEEF
jgi:hypothetical protein